MNGRITGHTELLTLMAYPIRHSASPAMHNEAAACLGLDYVYLCFDVDNSNLGDAIGAMRALKVRGGNISMPNKIAVIRYLDKLSEAAELCGSVNTIVNDGGVLTGHNTDGSGYVAALEDCGVGVAGRIFTLVGTGGAGSSIMTQLALNGAAEISVFNRRDEFNRRGRELVDKLNGRTTCALRFFDLEDTLRLRREVERCDVFANATSVGMGEQEGASVLPSRDFLRPELIVTDVIYAPRETALLRMARDVGCGRMNGEGMMLFQGAKAFRLWTGRDMPIEHMKEFLGITMLQT